MIIRPVRRPNPLLRRVLDSHQIQRRVMRPYRDPDQQRRLMLRGALVGWGPAILDIYYAPGTVFSPNLAATVESPALSGTVKGV